MDLKKTILPLISIFFLMSTVTFAQTETNKNYSKGEVKINFLNTILLGSVELGYEHFIAKNQSIGFETHFNDRFSYVSAKGSKKFDATSIQASYNFYFEGDKADKVYVFPFLKFRFGEYTEASDGLLNVTNMNSFLLGLGGGYKWVFNDKFAFGPYASIARGFSSEVNDTFFAVEFKAGISVGFRF